MITCPLCGGEGVETACKLRLGILGNLQHLRCRNCGIDFHIDVEVN
jgi:transcription elongation factor Elf1